MFSNSCRSSVERTSTRPHSTRTLWERVSLRSSSALVRPDPADLSLGASITLPESIRSPQSRLPADAGIAARTAIIDQARDREATAPCRNGRHGADTNATASSRLRPA